MRVQGQIKKLMENREFQRNSLNLYSILAIKRHSQTVMVDMSREESSKAKI